MMPSADKRVGSPPPIAAVYAMRKSVVSRGSPRSPIHAAIGTSRSARAVRSPSHAARIRDAAASKIGPNGTNASVTACSTCGPDRSSPAASHAIDPIGGDGRTETP